MSRTILAPISHGHITRTSVFADIEKNRVSRMPEVGEKRGLVTGASRGLGKEIANEFSQNGWGVISGFDVTTRRVIHEVTNGIDRLDVVINNAGINNDQLLLRISCDFTRVYEDWDA